MINGMDSQVIGVSEFIAILNETMAFAYPSVVVEGEVASFKVNQGKWVFFDIKDEESTLSCFMPVYQLKVPLEDGMKVRVTGVPKLTKWGKFSLTAKVVELAGEGELRRAFELLRKRLGDEGLFESARKRPLPKFPASIGVVTSKQSAAYSDFVKILAARWGGLKLAVADVQVQGAPAPDQIIRALDYFNQLSPPVDVVVLIRGGGSLEDLQAFNTEAVARAVAASRTPIIVGVGHEIDESLADFAADVRAATPTDAARLVVPDRLEVRRQVEQQGRAIESYLVRRLDSLAAELVRHTGVVERLIHLPRLQVERLESMLRRDLEYFGHSLEARRELVSGAGSRLLVGQQGWMRRWRLALEAVGRVLGSFDPTATLKRGYAIVRAKGAVVRSPTEVLDGDELVIQLRDGMIQSKVEKI